MSAEDHYTPCTAFGAKKRDDGNYPADKMAHQCSLSKIFNAQGARRASQVTLGCQECDYCDQTFLTPQGKASHKNAYRAKDHRLKKWCMPNCRVNLRDVMSVEVPQTGADSPEAGVSEEVEEACSDSLAAGVSEEVQEVGVDSLVAEVIMELQEVDYDSGDELCRFFGGEGEIVPAGKANMTPDDIVKGLDAWHESVEKHGSNKEKIITEVMRDPLPNGINQPKFEKTTLTQCIKKYPEYRASENLASSCDRRQGILRQRDGKYPEMEIKLAVNIKHLREIGLSVDKHVLELEGRTIFHKLNPRN